VARWTKEGGFLFKENALLIAGFKFYSVAELVGL
jgi:hypothetical protein